MKRAVAAGALLGAGALLTGCSTTLTPDRVSPSVAEVFDGLYAAQQSLVGRTDLVGQAVQPLASCLRTGTDPTGPGEDWTCTVQYRDNGTPTVQTFEVQLKPDGCWTANGPPGTQPATLTDSLTGTARTNPLASFDGCLDTSLR